MTLDQNRIQKRLGERIKKARNNKGVTQDQLIEQMGQADRSALSEWETGKRKLPAALIPALAQFLDVPITYFFLGEMKSEDDFETGLLEWFRTVPNDKRRRVFEFLEVNAPLIIGGEG
jgi:transcriptional regulator with XRE-family HTH domain